MNCQIVQQEVKVAMASNTGSSVELELESIRLYENRAASVSALPEDSGLEVCSCSHCVCLFTRDSRMLRAS